MANAQCVETAARPVIRLAELAYTLQVGRTAMNSRLAFVAGTTSDLVRKLEEFIDGKPNKEDCFVGEVKTSASDQNEDLNGLIRNRAANGNLRRLAQQWVTGLNLDWKSMYTGPVPGRITLPTYPFANERCWPVLRVLENCGGQSSQGTSSGNTTVNQDNHSGACGDNEEKILRIWQEVLGNSAIDPDRSFFDMGGDSIKVLQVLTLLTAADFKVTAEDFYRQQTVRNLARNLSQSKDLLKSRLDKLARIFEVEPDPESDEISPKLIEYHERNKQYIGLDYADRIACENVLLTGATGYLGAYLMQSLLEFTPYRLHVLVRGADLKACEQRLEQTFDFYFGMGEYGKHFDRVSIVRGDLTQELFGLSAEEYETLAGTVDCIINPAANVKHSGPAEDFVEINVRGVERLIKFASHSKKKDVHHVSTSFIAGGTFPGHETLLFTEYDGDQGQKLHNVYLDTKLQAENVVTEARNNGLRCSIYRVGTLVFDTKSGGFQKNVGDNGFYNYLKTSLSCGQMVESRRNNLDFTFIDTACKAITLLFDKQNLANETYHVYNPHRISSSRLLQLINESDAGFAVEGCSFLSGDHVKSNAWINSMLTADAEFTDVLQVNDKTTMILGDLGLKWEAPNAGHIKKMIDHCKAVNFLAV